MAYFVAMIYLRSFLFNAAYYGLMFLFVLVSGLPGLVLPRGFTQGMVAVYSKTLSWLLKNITNITEEVQGREHLPNGPMIIACKHQSSWETFFFYQLLDDPVYVLKIELRKIPLWGQLASHAGMIFVDRKGGASSLRSMLRGARQAVRQGSEIVIFPEGVRVRPGDREPYHPGIYALYREFPEVPVIPVALNSGYFWPRLDFRRPPGKIILKVLPAMPKGLSRDEFMDGLRERIEDACADLKPR